MPPSDATQLLEERRGASLMSHFTTALSDVWAPSVPLKEFRPVHREMGEAADSSADGGAVPMAITVDQYLDDEAGGWGHYQAQLSLNICLNYSFIAVDNLMGVFLVEALDRPGPGSWSLSLSRQQMLKSGLYLGGLVGYLLSGPIADRHGRRLTAISFTWMRCIAGFAVFAAPSYGVLFVGRVLSGVACAGAYNGLYTLLAEFAPPSSRTRVKRDLGLWWQAGVVYLVCCAWLLRAAPWQALCLMYLPSTCMAVWLLSAPESPRFLLISGQPDAAMRALQKVALANVGTAPRDGELSLRPPALADGSPATPGRAAAVAGDDGWCGGIRGLFSEPQQARTTLALTVMSLVASGTYYALAFAPGGATGVSDQRVTRSNRRAAVLHPCTPR